jgi:tetratricopeptide (TPR) repeat protein
VRSTQVSGYVSQDMVAMTAMRDDYLQNTYLAQLDSRDAVVEHLQLSRVFYINQDYPRAQQELLAIPETGRDAATWNNLGNVQLAVGEIPQALSSYEAARRLDPQDPGIALNRGLALTIAGEENSGREELAAAVDGARSVEGAMELLGTRSTVSDPTARAGEDVALERLSLETVEQLLRQASGQYPSKQAADSLQAGTAADSVGATLSGPAATRGVSGEAARRTMPTLAGGSRGEQIQPKNVVDVLYWKRP